MKISASSEPFASVADLVEVWRSLHTMLFPSFVLAHRGGDAPPFQDVGDGLKVVAHPTCHVSHSRAKAMEAKRDASEELV